MYLSLESKTQIPICCDKPSQNHIRNFDRTLHYFFWKVIIVTQLMEADSTNALVLSNLIISYV